jgi:glycosyltransferase involved in cell wall biosynthesis
MFWRLSRLMRDIRPEIVHTHNYVLRYFLPAAGWGRQPIIVHTIHNVADKEVDRPGVWLQRLAFRRRVRPVAIGEEVEASFDRVYGLPRPAVIPYGIDVERYAGGAAARESWRRRNGFGPADLLFVCVARFFPQKNHKTLIDAFASGPGRLPDTRLLLAGDGYLRPAVERQVQEAGLSDRVRFLGRREDIPDLLAASDVFVLASLWEGNPLSVMEAMAAGLPAVVTAVGGVPELVESGRQGWVVPPSGCGALSAAMMRLAENASLRRSMGAAAAARAHARFGQEQMVKTYESLYEELLYGASAGKNDVRAAARNGVLHG